MKHPIIIFLLLTSIFAFSQEKKLYSIGAALETYKVRDSTRVSLLIDYTKYHQVRSVDSMLPLVQEAMAISKEINYKAGAGYSRNALATYNLMKGNIEEALKAALEAKTILQEINDVSNLTFNNNLLARLYVRNGQSQKALEMHLANLELIKKDLPSDQKGGFYYYAAQAYERLDSLDQAQLLYKEAYSISDKAGFKLGKVLSSVAIGNLYNQRKEFTKAITPLTEALQFHQTNSQSYSVALTQYALAYSYAGIGNYKEALKSNSDAIIILKEQNRKIDLRNAYKNQVTYQRALGDLKGENEALKNYHSIKDTIFSEDKMKVIEELQTRYETEKIISEKQTAEAQATLAQEKSIRNRNLLIAAIAVAGLILLSSILFFSRIKAKKKAEIITLELKETQKRLAIEKQYRDSELKALKAQMNPHFIFNALNSIQEYIILNKKNLAGDYLGKFADLMRKYLHHSDAGTLSVQDEVDSLEMYLELEALRFEETLSYEFKVSEEINKEHVFIPTMLIQPYVENALKHGLLHRKADRKLAIIFIKETDTSISCIIEDNGVGRKRAAEIKAQRDQTHASFATKATENRLDLLNYQKDKKIGVEIIDLFGEDGSAKGTRVVLHIPTLIK